MNDKILVTGRMSRRTLERALYSGWAVESFHGDADGMVAVVTATVANASTDYMMGRLSSFGTVGVRSEFTFGDVAEAMERYGLVARA